MKASVMIQKNYMILYMQVTLTKYSITNSPTPNLHINGKDQECLSALKEINNIV